VGGGGVIGSGQHETAQGAVSGAMFGAIAGLMLSDAQPTYVRHSYPQPSWQRRGHDDDYALRRHDCRDRHHDRYHRHNDSPFASAYERDAARRAHMPLEYREHYRDHYGSRGAYRDYYAWAE